jgi:hypothetical protein
MRMEHIDADFIRRRIAWTFAKDAPRMLRAVSFSFSPYVPPTHGNVRIRAHFFSPPTEDDLEALSMMETYLYADTTEFDFETEVQLAPVGTKIYPREHIAWVDPMEVHREA